jgi:mRNA interferase RelE/StbE
MNYTIRFYPGARRHIEKLPRQVLLSVQKAISALADDPRPPGFLKMKGGKKQKFHRIRVGDYRVIYEVDDARRLVDIFIVADRREAYRGM